MNRPKFTVIQGGLAAANRKNTFVSAYVTDTRLMGVLAVYAHWQVEVPASGDRLPDIHQFFYIDCEEAGDNIEFSVKLPCGSGEALNLNPSLLMDFLQQHGGAPIWQCRVLRTHLYNKAGMDFE